MGSVATALESHTFHHYHYERGTTPPPQRCTPGTRIAIGEISKAAATGIHSPITATGGMFNE